MVKSSAYALGLDVDTVARGRGELLSGQVLRERVRRVAFATVIVGQLAADVFKQVFIERRVVSHMPLVT
jgi:hypothetical protein